MENPIVWALIATLGTWAVTAAGAATVFLFRRPSPEAMNRMLGFSAGVMIAASFWSLLQPAIARAAEQDGLPPWLVATLGFLLGAVFLWASDRVVTCVSCRSERGNGANRVVLLILAITLHNIPEGLAVAVPFAYATRSRAAGVLAALVSGLAEPLGAVLAWLFLRRFFTPGFLNGTVVLAAGIMVWVSFAQLLPDAFAPKHRAAGILGAAAGTLLMLLGIAALP